MIKLRNQLKSFWELNIGEGKPLPEYDSVSDHHYDKWGGVCLISQVVNEEYFDEGDQDQAHSKSLVILTATKKVGKREHREVSEEVELLIKKLYKFVKANRTFGTNWILNTEVQPRFLYGSHARDGTSYEYSQFKVTIKYQDSLSE